MIRTAFVLITCALHVGLRTYVTEQLQQLGYKPCRMVRDGHVSNVSRILYDGMDGESRFRPGQHHYVAVPDIEPTAWRSQLSPGALSKVPKQEGRKLGSSQPEVPVHVEICASFGSALILGQWQPALYWKAFVALHRTDHPASFSLRDKGCKALMPHSVPTIVWAANAVLMFVVHMHTLRVLCLWGILPPGNASLQGSRQVSNFWFDRSLGTGTIALVLMSSGIDFTTWWLNIAEWGWRLVGPSLRKLLIRAMWRRSLLHIAFNWCQEIMMIFQALSVQCDFCSILNLETRVSSVCCRQQIPMLCCFVSAEVSRIEGAGAIWCSLQNGTRTVVFSAPALVAQTAYWRTGKGSFCIRVTVFINHFLCGWLQMTVLISAPEQRYSQSFLKILEQLSRVQTRQVGKIVVGFWTWRQLKQHLPQISTVVPL